MLKKLQRRAAATLTALIAVLALTAVAQAQTAYYREVEKDGRIFVFNIPTAYKLWEGSGEAGVGAITLLGYGPKGETMVFDSENAIHLYNFKHDKPGEVFKTASAAPAPKPTDNFSIKVGATIFADFTYQDDPKVTDADKNSVRKSEFEARRAYINITGNVSDIVSFRITPDVASRLVTTNTALPTGSSVSTNLDGSAPFRLKYAFGQFSLDKVIGKGSWARIGQQQTPWVDFYEGIYRYRFQGTIFEEREGFLSSADNGLSARIALPKDYGDIHAGIYNGDTYSKAEANDQKAFMVRGSLRPLPKEGVLKGLRLTAFYDADKVVKDAPRNRLIGALTFEHQYLNLGFSLLDAKTQASAATAAVKARGFSVWATPRLKSGLEGLVRYDSLKPDKSVDALKKRTLVGVAYWFKVMRSGLATAILGDYEEVSYDTALAKPKEKRFELKTLFNF